MLVETVPATFTQYGETAPASFTQYDLSNFYFGRGDHVADLPDAFAGWWRDALPGGYHLYREPLQSAPDREVLVRSNRDGQTRRLINFSSYNYLGMATADVVKRAAVAAIERYGLGASGRPILSGMFEAHRELEAELAAFKRIEACTLFPTGYAANVGVISGLMRAGDHVFLDQFSHASLVEGAVLSKATPVYFRHNCADDLYRKLRGVAGRKLVVVEGVYPMDGDFCDLPAVVEVARWHGANVMIDEAHSAFICGPTGRGVAEYFGLEDEIDLHIGTMSKALGGIGGYVCASARIVEYLEAYARSRFFSCTLPPAVTLGVLAAARHLIAHPEIRQRLWTNARRMRELLVAQGIDVGECSSQVIPVMPRADRKAFAIGERIREEGLFLQPATYPGVPKGRSRLRVSVSALHTEDDLTTGANVIAHVLREFGVLA
jgi:8-amino-7-oxononanoate synthase